MSLRDAFAKASVKPVSVAASPIEKLSYWSILAYLASQAWGIPVLVFPGVSWALWPLLSDFVWLIMLLLAGIILLRGIPDSAKSRSVILLMILFVFYASFSFALAWLRFGLPDSQIFYFGYSLFRLSQFFTVWIVAVGTPLAPKQQQHVVQVIVLAGIFVGGAALFQQFGLLDYRLLVSHLPSDAISGPWAIRTMLLPDAALGTLNYNRIYTGHFLASVILMLLIAWRSSFQSMPLLFCLGAALLATQSRTAFIPLVVGIGCSFILKPRLMSKMIIIFLLIALGGLFFISSVDFQSVATVPTRNETLEESFSGRFERQAVVVDVMSEDVLSLFFGVGLGNLGYFWLGGGFSPSHGQFATIMAEMGIIGLILFLFLIYRLTSSVSPTNPFALACTAILVGNILSGLFNDLLMPSPAFGHYLGFLYCLAGLGVSVSRQDESPRSFRQV